ncbi:MAG: 50S ribosomal protein L21 [Chlamydiia bacterium]|nr:50S ribosomal protein L21 [Chlamydiia bacterium]
MYAIIQTGGKQYKVQKGDLIDVELLEGTDGDSVEFSDVLFIGGKDAKVGEPTVAGSVVKGKMVETTYGEKVNGMTYKRRKNVRRRFGHRQRYTRVEITDIKTK